MSAIVPISNRSNHNEITRLTDLMRRRIASSQENDYQHAPQILGPTDWPSFQRLSGKWTCRARRANVRFEQTDWQNTLVAEHCTLGQLTVGVSVMEDNFWLAFYSIEGIRDSDSNLNFRVDDQPIKSVQVKSQEFYKNVCVSWDEAIALARYMTGGKRLAVEYPGYFTAVFNIAGFEFANFDPLRRFVFA